MVVPHYEQDHHLNKRGGARISTYREERIGAEKPDAAP